jgi:DNA-binding NarL/FixJ family response regulator
VSDVSAPRVVLIDDAVRLRDLLREALGRHGLEVVGEAGDGRSGVCLVEDLSPDVVLLDLAMPGMDGLESISQIRRRSPKTRIVVLSGFEAAHVSRRALALGAHAYLEKGISPRALVATIRAVHENGHAPVTVPPSPSAESNAAQAG